MKSLKLFIRAKDFKRLLAFSDEGYLYNYIVNNATELDEDNIFRNPTISMKLEDMIYIAKMNINKDDELVWKETSRDLRRKKVSYCAIIIDSKDNTFTVDRNLIDKMPYLENNTDTEVIRITDELEKQIDLSI
ncbi:MAG: hypothetical protein KIC56_03960 [Clostridium sp.]|nr:hypothetical protein [Clostridium sp.]